MLLFLVLFGVSLAVDPVSSLGSDVGGKTATMTTLSADGSLDLGYWAQPLDPDGSLYPFFGTSVLDDQWVNATTLPMLLLAWPLHEVGGMHLAMVLPVLGAVFTAAAARRLATLLGPTDGVAAFWIVGLATPVTVYSLAFWEHGPGLAFMAWGVVCVVTAINGGRALPALLAGLCFGVAATMRQEALVYGVVVGMWLIFGAAKNGSLQAMVRSGSAMVAGVAAMLVANSLLERAVLGTSFRSSRASGTAGAAGSEFGARVHDALITVWVPSGIGGFGIALGLVLFVGSVLMAKSSRSIRDHPLMGLMVILPVLLTVTTVIVGGGSFIPSLLFTTPLAGLGVGLGWGSRATRAPMLVALVAIPLVLAVQSTGGFEAQWGGRYLLLSGWMLTVIACALAPSLPADRLGLMATLGVVVTATGVGWTIVRSHDVADFHRELVARQAPAVVYSSSLTARGAGPIALEQQFLAAENIADRFEAATLLTDAGVPWFLYVSPDFGSSAPEFEGYVETDSSPIDFVGGLDFRLRTFEVAG